MPAPGNAAFRKLRSPCRLQKTLTGWQQKAVFLSVIGLPAVLVGGKAAELVFASACTQIGTLPELQWARAADPQDPEVYERMGEAQLYGFLNSNPEAAFRNLRRAAALAPARPLDWEVLGLALESVHEYRSAQAALERARDLDPTSPQVHWLVANCDLSAGDAVKALPELKRTLYLDASYSRPVYDFCLRAGISPRTVTQLVLPRHDRARFRLNFATYLAAEGQIDASADVWKDAVISGGPFEFVWAQPYVDELMRDRDFARAYQAWRDLERLAVIQNPQGTDPAELLFNGGFEREPLNSGFDWHYDPLHYIRLDFADPHAYDGKRCLRIDFIAPSNGEYTPLYQDVPAEPNQRYSLTAFVRSVELTSQSGPRLRVVDLNDPAGLDVAGEPTLGTTAWHRVQVSFATGPDTRFVQVLVWRPRGVDFPTEISGSFWIDDVSLKPAA